MTRRSSVLSVRAARILCRSKSRRRRWEWYGQSAGIMSSVIVPLLYKVTRKLLTVPSVLLRRGAVKDAELMVLRHENAVLPPVGQTDALRTC